MSSANKCLQEYGVVKQDKLCDVEKRLHQGMENYAKGEFYCINQEPKRIEKQKPYAAILSCADSRVDPERIFDAGPGELFVTRVAGNVATEEIIASIEYAVAVLNTRAIVVIGHEACGAVDAAIAQVTDPDPNGKYAALGYNLDRLLSMIRPAVVAVGKAGKVKNYKVVKKNAELSAMQLFERSAILTQFIDEIDLYYGYYQLGVELKLIKLRGKTCLDPVEYKVSLAPNG